MTRYRDFHGRTAQAADTLTEPPARTHLVLGRPLSTSPRVKELEDQPGVWLRRLADLPSSRPNSE
jgi:hypothetical protein